MTNPHTVITPTDVYAPVPYEHMKDHVIARARVADGSEGDTQVVELAFYMNTVFVVHKAGYYNAGLPAYPNATEALWAMDNNIDRFVLLTDHCTCGACGNPIPIMNGSNVHDGAAAMPFDNRQCGVCYTRWYLDSHSYEEAMSRGNLGRSDIVRLSRSQVLAAGVKQLVGNRDAQNH